MAKVDTLPIFLSSYRLVSELYRTTSKFDKNFKYSLGQDIQSDAMRLMRLMYQANQRENKVADLEDFLGVYELLKLQIRLAKDLNQISIKKMAHLSLMMTDIGKQAVAWIKHEKQRVIKKTGEEPVSPVFEFSVPRGKAHYPKGMEPENSKASSLNDSQAVSAAGESSNNDSQAVSAAGEPSAEVKQIPEVKATDPPDPSAPPLSTESRHLADGQLLLKALASTSSDPENQTAGVNETSHN